jgi:uncharacterized membrane protein YGL010W
VKTLEQQLANYAAYHRDSRNVLTHLVGIPLIVLAAATLLSRPAAGMLSPAVLVWVILAVYYVRLDMRFGLLMTALLGLCVWAGAGFAARGTGVWLTAGLGMFGAGWVIQFVGHYFEGRKPAFLDDVMGLAIGPLFIVAELCFWAGLRADVRRAVEARGGGNAAA